MYQPIKTQAFIPIIRPEAQSFNLQPPSLYSENWNSSPIIQSMTPLNITNKVVNFIQSKKNKMSKEKYTALNNSIEFILNLQNKTKSTKTRKQLKRKRESIGGRKTIKAGKKNAVKRKKIGGSIKNEEPILIIYENNAQYTNPSIYLKKNNEEVGYFAIQGFYNEGAKSMTVFVDDDYNKKGLSRLMIVAMLYIFKYFYKVDNDGLLLSVGADSSNGFWDNIGMTDNRYYNSERDMPIRGYEKIITLKTLSSWALSFNIFNE